VQTEIVFPASDGRPMPGVLTVPEGATGPVPGLVMIYEIWGMTGEMRRVARDLAADGYAVLMPDLFAAGRVKALCVAATMRAMVKGEGRALDDLDAARAWLAERPEVDGGRLGAIGFCMGGGFALLLARTGLYKVSAPFYGGQGVELPRSCPVVASFGGRDAGMRGVPEKVEADLERLGVPHDVKVYPEAGHSFYTQSSGLRGRLLAGSPIHAGYHKASAEDAHRRVVAFFAEHL
jgi:carboxymethylenebutenolidase